MMNELERDGAASDAELVERVQHGNLTAFETLIRRYERLVRAAVLHVTRDRHAAEDISQETFLTAYRSLQALRESDKFGSWLLAIARNQASRCVRTQIRAPICVPDIETACPSAGNESTDSSERLLELIERLPDHERLVIGLKYFSGYTVDEISRISGRPVGTITKQLSRAHARLAESMQKETHK
jgi:RNA polymerase sigma-70 factor (ECF subfamily)